MGGAAERSGTLGQAKGLAEGAGVSAPLIAKGNFGGRPHLSGKGAAIIDLFAWEPPAPAAPTPVTAPTAVLPMVPAAPIPAGALSLAALIDGYQTDPSSSFHDIRHATRTNYLALQRRLRAERGDVALCTINARMLREWHAAWSLRGTTIAHSLIVQLRIVFSFGLTFLENEDCERLSVVMSKMKFRQGKPRTQVLTAEQVTAIRAEAHKQGRPSIALAQAIQFEGTLRQKDVIGEVIPLDAPGDSEIVFADGKWVSGMVWSEIDHDLILRHVTSKRQKKVEIDLREAPMVLEELALTYPSAFEGGLIDRAKLPASGPVIVSEKSGFPYLFDTFRRTWRKLANAVGVPKDVQNRDTRAGAITEAIESGASLEDARKTAAHSNASMTARYSRNDAQAITKTMKGRAANRSRPAGVA